MESDDNVLLFKSTSRREYRQRILTALSLPEGIIWKTHYRRRYCSNGIREYVFEDNGRRAGELVGKKGVLVFVDIESRQAKFFPLREFEIALSEVHGRNWEVGLRFGKYLAYSSQDIDDFQRFLRDSGIILPPGDQSFAHLFPSIEDDFKECASVDPTTDFQSVVTHIVNDSHQSCFRSCDSEDNPAIFFRLEIDRVCSAGNISKVDIDPQGEMTLKPGRYTLRFSYFAPNPEDIGIEDHFYIEFGSSSSLERRKVIVYPDTSYKPEEFSFEVQAKPSTVRSEIRITRKDFHDLAPLPTIPYVAKASLLEKITSSSKIGLIIFGLGASMSISSLFFPEVTSYLLSIGPVLMSLGVAIIGKG